MLPCWSPVTASLNVPFASSVSGPNFVWGIPRVWIRSPLANPPTREAFWA